MRIPEASQLVEAISPSLLQPIYYLDSFRFEYYPLKHEGNNYSTEQIKVIELGDFLYTSHINVDFALLS